LYYILGYTLFWCIFICKRGPDVLFMVKTLRECTFIGNIVYNNFMSFMSAEKLLFCFSFETKAKKKSGACQLI